MGMRAAQLTAEMEILEAVLRQNGADGRGDGDLGGRAAEERRRGLQQRERGRPGRLVRCPARLRRGLHGLLRVEGLLHRRLRAHGAALENALCKANYKLTLPQVSSKTHTRNFRHLFAINFWLLDFKV